MPKIRAWQSGRRDSEGEEFKRRQDSAKKVIRHSQMGGCEGDRKRKGTKEDPFTDLELGLKLSEVPWKRFIEAAAFSLPPTGPIPAPNLAQLFAELGLTEAYHSHESRLQQLMSEVATTTNRPMDSLIFLGLFLCAGKEEDKCRYFCCKLNGMRLDKQEVAVNQLYEVLQELMCFSIQVMPRVFEKDKAGDGLRFKTTSIVDATNLWFPPARSLTISNALILKWFLDSNFSSSAARAAARKVTPQANAKKNQENKTPTTLVQARDVRAIKRASTGLVPEPLKTQNLQQIQEKLKEIHKEDVKAGKDSKKEAKKTLGKVLEKRARQLSFPSKGSGTAAMLVQVIKPEGKPAGKKEEKKKVHKK